MKISYNISIDNRNEGLIGGYHLKQDYVIIIEILSENNYFIKYHKIVNGFITL